MDPNDPQSGDTKPKATTKVTSPDSATKKKEKKQIKSLTDMKRTCGWCVYFDKNVDEGGDGVCHGVPPTVVQVEGEDEPSSIRATVGKDERACSLFQFKN